MSFRLRFLLPCLGSLLFAASPGASAQLSETTQHGEPLVVVASTTLVWADTPSPGALDWPSAEAWAASLNTFVNADGTVGYGGYTDWHLSTANQTIYLLVNELDGTGFGPFAHLTPNIYYYWLGTSGPAAGQAYLWVVPGSYLSWDTDSAGINTGLPTGAMAVRGTLIGQTCDGQTGSGQAGGSGTFSVVEIPPAAAYPTIPPTGLALNACGAVTGTFSPFGYNIQQHVFLYQNGVTEDLKDDAATCGAGAIGYAINSSGVIAGAFCYPAEQQGFFTWNYGTYLDELPGNIGVYSAWASAINTSGLAAGTLQVTTGTSGCPANYYHPFLYNPNALGTGITDLNSSIQAIGGCGGQGLAINDSGQIAGYFTDNHSNPHAYLYSAGTVADLGNLGYQFAYAYGVNASGQVTGDSYTCSGCGPDAFLYTAGNATIGVTCHPSTPVSPNSSAEICDLGNLGGLGGSQGNGINASGQIVGQSWTTGNAAQHAFLFSNNSMLDLNSEIASSSPSPCTPVNGTSPCTLTNAVAINDSGQILAQGYLNSNPTQTVSFLLTPTSAAALTATVTATSINSSGNYVVTITITDTGNSPANGVELTSASIVVVQSGKAVSIPTSTALPTVLDGVVPGATETLTLSFPATAGAAGAAAALRWNLTSSTGSAGGTLRFALP